MLRKILLSSILILAVGGGSKSFKNGVYDINNSEKLKDFFTTKER